VYHDAPIGKKTSSFVGLIFFKIEAIQRRGGSENFKSTIAEKSTAVLNSFSQESANPSRTVIEKIEEKREVK